MDHRKIANSTTTTLTMTMTYAHQSFDRFTNRSFHVVIVARPPLCTLLLAKFAIDVGPNFAVHHQVHEARI